MDIWNKIKAERDRIDPVFLVILLGGLALRLYNLGKYSFWYDEAISILLGPKYILEGLSRLSIVGPGFSLFPFLMYLWKHLGNSEFVLRLLPALFGVLSIIVVYLLAKLLFDKRIAQLGAFIFSISPFQVYYSQELRYHTLVVFLVLLSVYFCIKSLKEDKNAAWIGFVAFTVLGIYSHFMAIFILAALNLYYIFFFARYKRLGHKWVMAQVCMLFLLIPWFMIIFRQLSLATPFITSAFIRKPSLLTLLNSFIIFNAGYGAPPFICYLALFLCLVLLITGILNIKKRDNEVLLLSWFLAPVILTFLISLWIRPIYLHRTLIYVTPACSIILACGIYAIKKKLIWLPLSLFVLISFVSLRNQYDNILPLARKANYQPGVFPKIANREAAEYIEKNFQEGDAVGHFDICTLMPFIYYHQDKFNEECIAQMDARNKRFYHLHSSPEFQGRFRFADKQFLKGKKRIWLVVSEFGAPLLFTRPTVLPGSTRARDWLEMRKNCTLLETRYFPGIMVRLFKIKS